MFVKNSVFKVVNMRKTREIYQFGLSETERLTKPQADWLTRINKVKPAIQARKVVNFTICVSTPLFGNRYKALDIIKFIEINRILG